MNLITLFCRQFKREWLIQVRQLGSLANASLFFLMMVFMFPMTLELNTELLRSLAPGIVFMALLLFALLASERMYQQDEEQGILEQWLVSGVSLPVIVFAKILVHWIYHTVPVLLLTPLAALFYGLSSDELMVLLLAIVCASPALYFICALAAAFGIGVNHKSTLMGLVVLPLVLPLLIFASGMVHVFMQGLPVSGYVALLLALSLLCLSFLPWVVALVIRILCSE